jgi:putative addiction module component (TIGR02574 family)
VEAGRLDRGYTDAMSLPLHTLTTEAMALDPADRLRLATELIDSVEGPADRQWAERWNAELQRRTAAASEREAQGLPRGAEWSEVKERLLRGLARR